MTPQQVYSVMVLCAADADTVFGRLAQHGDNPTLPAAGTAGIAYLTTAYWAPIAQLRCDDLIITKGENCYYGFLLRCQAAFGPFQAGDVLCAVRGTMDPLEWVDDALAEIPKSVPGRIGQVGGGFWDVYASMTLNTLAGGVLNANAAAGIAAQVTGALAGQAGRLHITGHSLGAALATYLTSDLTTALAGSQVTLHPYFFASPKPGTSDYVMAYQKAVAAYALVDYAGDLVPKLPSDPPFHALLAGGPAQDVHPIPLGAPDAPPFSVANNHSPVGYARMLDPTNPVAAALPLY